MGHLLGTEEQIGLRLDGRTQKGSSGPAPPRGAGRAGQDPVGRSVWQGKGAVGTVSPAGKHGPRALGPVFQPMVTRSQGRGHPSQPSLSPREPLASCCLVHPPEFELALEIKRALSLTSKV